MRRGRRRDRRRHLRDGGHLRGGPARRRRRLRAGRRAARRGRPRRRVRAAPARPPRRARAGDGLLLLRQRRRRGPPRPVGARRRAGADPRLGRPPRQRDQRDLPRRPERAVRLDPRVAAVSRHGPGLRRRLGRGDRLHGQPARARRHRRRGLPLARRARRREADPATGARSWSSSRRASTRTSTTRWRPAASPRPATRA